VYVPKPELGSITVKIRGERTWYLDVPLEFRKPKPGDVWKGHGFKIVCSWPKVEVHSDRPFPDQLLNRCLGYFDFAFYLPDGRRGDLWDTMGIGGGGGGGGRYSGRFGENPVYAWCGCRNAPTRVERIPIKESQKLEVDTGPHVRPITDYEAVHVDFRALISEEFEVTSDPLRTADR
jgi:hypothetical protein